MRHGKVHRKLNRTAEHRRAMFANMCASLIKHEQIVTTLPKAKELRPIAERVITRGKHGTLHDRRWVLRWVLKRELVKKVFDDIAPRFQERPGGYLRIVKLMYFDDPVDNAPLEARRDTRALLSINGLALLLLGIFPQWLLGMCVVALTRSY